MFKNIDLNKLSHNELNLLLKLVELYVSNNNPEVISVFDRAELKDYQNEILEAQCFSDPTYSSLFVDKEVGDRQAQLDKEEGFDNIDWVEQEDGSIEYV